MHDMTEQKESQRDGPIPVVNTFMFLVPVMCVDTGMDFMTSKAHY